MSDPHFCAQCGETGLHERIAELEQERDDAVQLLAKARDRVTYTEERYMAQAKRNIELCKAIEKHRDADAGLIIDCVDQELWEVLDDG